MKSKSKIRTNIEARVIRGEQEFHAAYGVAQAKQTEWRSMGMPCYTDGKVFMYFADEVDAWIKNNFRIQLPEIRMTNLRAV